MITTYDICKELIEAIAVYKPLKYFCWNKFKRQPKYYFEIDPNNPPPNDDVPIIALYQGDVLFDEPGAARRSVTFACAIYDKEIDTSTSATAMYRGYRTAEFMENLIYRAIEKYADESVRNISIIDLGNTGVRPFYPYFHSVRTLEIITGR